MMASHLWWQVPVYGRADNDPEKVSCLPGSDWGTVRSQQVSNMLTPSVQPQPLLRDGKRVLECLQKALRIANSCIDERSTVEIFCSALDQYLYYVSRPRLPRLRCTPKRAAPTTHALTHHPVRARGGGHYGQVHQLAGGADLERAREPADGGAAPVGGGDELHRGARLAEACQRHFRSQLLHIQARKQAAADGLMAHVGAEDDGEDDDEQEETAAAAEGQEEKGGTKAKDGEKSKDAKARTTRSKSKGADWNAVQISNALKRWAAPPGAAAAAAGAAAGGVSASNSIGAI